MSNPYVERTNTALMFDTSRLNDDAYVACVSQNLEELFDELDSLIEENNSDENLILCRRAVSLAFTFLETTGTLPGNIACV